MPDCKQALNVRIAQEVPRILTGWKLQDHHPLWLPIAFNRRGDGTLNDVPAAMLGNEGGDVVDVFLERREIMDGKVKDKIGFHYHLRGPSRNLYLSAWGRAAASVTRFASTRARNGGLRFAKSAL